MTEAQLLLGFHLVINSAILFQIYVRMAVFALQALPGELVDVAVLADQEASRILVLQDFVGFS